jgi:hypothetical protein
VRVDKTEDYIKQMKHKYKQRTPDGYTQRNPGRKKKKECSTPISKQSVGCGVVPGKETQNPEILK